MRIALGVFVIAHALVHAMYVAHALRWFELKPGMAWPDDSWALGSLRPGAVRCFAAISIALSALVMVVGGAGYLAGAGWGTWAVVGSAALVSVAHALLWSGAWSEFAEHGGIGVAINAALIVVVLATR